MTEERLLALQEVSFAYEGEGGQKETVLNRINLDIHKGAFVSVLGHNGSGKSTLAKLMNALLLPKEGTVLVTGIDTRDGELIWEVRRHVGMVFQNPDNQIVGATVEDDVAFGLENMGTDPAEMRTRIRESLQAVGMEAHLYDQPHRLSGGQKQRVAIAGIMAMRPSVLILDEATAMLDPMGRREVLNLARRLNREEGITVVNITHFPEEAVFSDRVIVMRAGQVEWDGTAAEVFADPDRLQALGLDVPFAVRVRHALAAEGVSLPFILHQEELVEHLCKLLLKR
ncbi:MULTISPECIES: energy-coupling factor transporter ATPase [Brevibacillus]|jgi:energy-coupling factor transport system ATP-binding protein|uniref:ABC transporter ATP-binding protein n=1 Tax=Brevibacillus borstelensis AK1 TaxID=1300222 RepID=M8E495_9BACL|nr:energy-coupling factor transporter ATPase [Brevibacillus borstelensis]EMT50305.1 ABC transporter ATP-binding protein [Brevibacillus borstelensis AK1]MBE5395093.1 energy-coupling factor transporter ATPase [Brevibacillus borstelensis]MCC0565394.1 energy-coupling factor transporter ATPase [Brevibacillus borstelensis]MCM3473034.1 energy-coupling factor transporter ATPase [Brevibacillus borstelensis]MCM3560332.1 energy-coupling factor transporter ATPase [Brevibacillus borstelensis]